MQTQKQRGGTRKEQQVLLYCTSNNSTDPRRTESTLALVHQQGNPRAALSALTQHRDSRGCFQSHLPSHQESHPRSHPPLTPVVRLCSSTREAPNNVHALPIPLLMAHPNEASSSRRCQLAKSLLRACDTSAIVPDRCARADPFQNPMKMASAISTKYCTRLVDQGKRRGPAP
jgi:hypothetical protein